MMQKTFRPKKLAQREKDFAVIKTKKILEYEIFLSELLKNFQALKNVRSVDPMEQLFIDWMKDCIRVDHADKNIFWMFLYTDGGAYVFDYYWVKKTVPFFC